MDNCEVKHNCMNAEESTCWHCEDYSHYGAIDKRIKCERQKRNKARRKAEKKELKQTDKSKLGRKSKRKGYAGENELVHLFEKFGIEAKRVPLSGALKGELGGDIVATVNGEKKKIESKRRADGFREIYKYLEQDGCEYIFMRADRKDWIVAMSFTEWLKMVR